MSTDLPTESPDRREIEDRRSTSGRRAADTEGRFALVPAFWATVGAAVVAYLFFMVLGDVRPGDAPVPSAIALGLAVLWLAHSWRRVVVGSRSPVGDRERRGF
ncbi:MAG: hypothetical protein ABIO51_07375 [Solirubrobacteraceae bacterium]